MEPFLKTSGLKFMDLIDYPDMTIASGRAVFITGESGSGKSTLLKLMNGVLSPSAGFVAYKGTPIAEYHPIALRRELLLCSQTVFLFNDTIRGNFKQFYEYRGQSPPGETTIEDYLRLCNLNFDLEAPCEPMSGGERHRVFIAVCLSFMPKALMLDEPTAALDAQNADILIRNIKSYCQGHGMTPIIICHDDALTKKYADDQIVLARKGGRPV